MIFSQTELSDLWLIDTEKRIDDRGHFARIFCEREFVSCGLPSKFVQANMSYNQRQGTLRGMHFQHAPYAEDKLVRCLKGSIFDVAVDLRADSGTFLKWFGAELSADNGRALLIPKGFAHGFVTLEDDVLVSYMVSEGYQPGHEAGLRWDDPEIGIEWPITPQVISQRDREHPWL